MYMMFRDYYKGTQNGLAVSLIIHTTNIQIEGYYFLFFLFVFPPLTIFVYIKVNLVNMACACTLYTYLSFLAKIILFTLLSSIAFCFIFTFYGKL